MRKPLIAAFLLVAIAVVLGTTVFRAQIVNAAPPPPPSKPVVVTNTSTNPVPVQQIGTSNANVSGTVSLDSNDATNLANVEGDLGNLKFDSSGKLETTAQTASPGAVTEQCTDGGSSAWSITSGSEDFPLCSSQDFYATDVTASGMDDDMVINLMHDGKSVLELTGSSASGADSYQLDLTHPIHVDEIDVSCNNGSSDCKFSLAVLGNSTGD